MSGPAMTGTAEAFAAARLRSLRIALACAAFAALMLGTAFAAAPLYDLFCRLTGFNGIPLRATSAPATVGSRVVTVRFDANVNKLPWRFAPEDGARRVRIGETVTAYYRITNTSDRPLTGVAAFNVEPAIASAYFNKVQCFCFNETTLQPGETLDLPVVFYIDPDIEKDADLKDLGAITLSYTFFPAANAAKPRS
jgi:cytochrome c oxidase assembly protein subunit 11